MYEFLKSAAAKKSLGSSGLRGNRLHLLSLGRFVKVSAPMLLLLKIVELVFFFNFCLCLCFKNDKADTNYNIMCCQRKYNVFPIKKISN